MAANNSFQLVVTLSEGVLPDDWADASNGYERPPSYGTKTESEFFDYGLYRWFLHAAGALESSVVVVGGEYSAVYATDTGIFLGVGIVGADGLPVFAETPLDIDAIAKAAAPDILLMPYLSPPIAGGATYLGEAVIPPPPRFWTGMVNAIETV
ncbi:hypothetical protein SAMN05216206_2746 [Pseudomonas guineae]|uniref:Uncharacterized protein n=1 Tax=Pseudomonas guineae TaxID=425504 RepID=A0A1I3K8E8_9PSED|nr:hypothetical protein [Pseudomonas guineae]SFI68674.1 hypothetical protein SAMN05216206_2746 [Pseudomonas guineae]